MHLDLSGCATACLDLSSQDDWQQPAGASRELRLPGHTAGGGAEAQQQGSVSGQADGPVAGGVSQVPSTAQVQQGAG